MHQCACAYCGGAIIEMKQEICKQDRQKLVDKCWEKAAIIGEVASRISWAKLWDATLDLGGNKAVRGLQFLSKIMSHRGREVGLVSCVTQAPLPSSVLDYILD